MQLMQAIRVIFVVPVFCCLSMIAAHLYDFFHQQHLSTGWQRTRQKLSGAYVVVTDVVNN